MYQESKRGNINALFDFSARTAVSYTFICHPPSTPTWRAFGFCFNKAQLLLLNDHKVIFGFSPLGVYVENLSEYSVKSPEEIVRLLKSGKRRLVVAETKMNRQSSRLV